jgi:hypothetical protein
MMEIQSLLEGKSMKNYIILVIISTIFFSGCVGIQTTKRLETVVDRVYIPKECPKFTHQLKIDGKKYTTNDVSQTMVIVPLDPFLESLERNKLARQEFNKIVVESNEPLVVPGEPETNNFKRVEKRIFVNRDCPKYTYKPVIGAKKLKSDFLPETNTTYVVITLDEMVTKLEQNKMARETYNDGVEEINQKSFVDAMKKKFNDVVEITVEKIDDTAAAIKKMAVDKTKTIVKDKAKEAVFGEDENTTK